MAVKYRKQIPYLLWKHSLPPRVPTYLHGDAIPKNLRVYVCCNWLTSSQVKYIMKTHPHIFIIDSYALNTGDLGILFATISTFRKQIPDVRLTVESSHPRFLSEFSEVQGITIYPRIFDIQNLVGNVGFWTSVREIFSGVFTSTRFLLWAIGTRISIRCEWLLPHNRRAQAKDLLDADILLSSGGGFLSSYYNYGFRLYLYMLGFILGKKVVIFSQSVGPFNSRISRLLIPSVLRRVSLITVREPWSRDYLRKVLPGVNIHLVNDIAFLLEVNKEISAKHDTLLSVPSVAFCVKATRDSEYIDSLIKASTLVQQHGYLPLFVSQTISDDSICYSLAKLAGVPNRIVPFGMSPNTLKAIYGKCAFIVANRMHAIIFAAELRVPFICLSYEPKFFGLFRLFEYNQAYLIDQNDIAKLSVILRAFIPRLSETSQDLEDIHDDLQDKSRLSAQLVQKII